MKQQSQPHMLTLAEACQRIGWTDAGAPQRLYKRLKAYERANNHLVVVTTAKGSPVRVAWHHILLVTRSSVSAVDRITGPEWERSLEELDARIADVADRRIDLRVVPELARLAEENENSAKAIEDLRIRVGR